METKQSLKSYSRSKTFFCCVTGEKIQPARVEYLLKEGVSEKFLTGLSGATLLHRPKKIIVIDDVGSEFICDHIDNTRAWESERFGTGDCSYEDEGVGASRKKVPDPLWGVEDDSLDALIKKQDAGEEDETDDL